MSTLSARRTPPPQWLVRLLTSATVVTLLCLGIAALLTVMRGGNFGTRLVYSGAVGLCSWALIDGGRHVLTFLLNRLRARRGLVALPGTGYPGWAGMLAVALLGMLLGTAMGMALGDALVGDSETHELFNMRSTSSQVTLLLSLFASLVAVVTLTSLQHLAAARTRAEAAQHAAAETRLRLLESQLEPHMLFNTLANLRVLIAADPPRAQAMLDQLIDFLRATLGASRVGQHPLSAEFARLADYLALMQVRMGDRLTTRLLLDANLATHPVPPLLLQPLVENCIKHGLEPQVRGGRIEVSAAHEGRHLVLRVRDTGVGLGATPAHGMRFGLLQVRERLATLYGDDAALELSPAPDAEGGALATLRLPWAGLPAAAGPSTSASGGTR